MQSRKCISIAAIAVMVSACSSTPDEGLDQNVNHASDPNDPFESFNRSVWDFNYEVLDKHVLRPAAVAYGDYAPKPVRSGLLNVVNNLDEPSSFVNNSLQGKFADAGVSVSRFVINTTIGVFGLFDIATKIGIEEKHEGFDETLGAWGVGSGPYVMLPAAGPSDPRDLTGRYVDGAYFPLADLTFWGGIGRFTVKALEGRIALMEQEQLLNESIDPYLFVKEAYQQRTEYKINDGKLEIEQENAEELDEFSDFEDEFGDL